MSPMARREAIEGYIWISPWILGFLTFVLGPMVASLALSFTSYEGLAKPGLLALITMWRSSFETRSFMDRWVEPFTMP